MRWLFALTFSILVAVPLEGTAEPRETSPKAEEPSAPHFASDGSSPSDLWRSKSEDEWKRTLTPEQFEICRKAGTERPFTGEHNENKREGVYKCSSCGNILFSSEAKFDSGTGWPSFSSVDESAVELVPDRSHGMERIEVRCARCGAHLGHVFDDGPAPTGKRYCINSVCLDFEPR